MFKHYEDPKEAGQIWAAYKDEIYVNGLGGEASVAADESRTSTELEAKLDLMLTAITRAADKGRLPNVADPDADGLYSNAVRAYEDTR